MIKAGTGRHCLDLPVELLVKFHRTFGVLIAGNPGYLGIHAPILPGVLLIPLEL